MAKRQPATSALPAVDHTENGIIIRLPPCGLSVGQGAFWVGLCFCVGVVLISTCFLVFPHLGETHNGVYVPPTHKPIAWQAWGLMALFGAISLAVTFFALSLARRSAVIEVDRETLRIEERGLFARRSGQWPRTDLKAIQTGPSGFSVGRTKKIGRAGAAGKSIQQLHIYLANRQRSAFLTGRTGRELDWIADQLRTTLKIGTVEYRGD